MRSPPPPSEIGRYPVTALITIGALAVSFARLAGKDVSALVLDVRAFRGEPWRVLTTALPHVDQQHLLFNLVWLWMLGTAVEGRFGSWALLGAAALLAGGPAIAEYALAGAGVGLSGVGYGLFGMLWVLRRRDPRLRDVVDGWAAAAFALWFVICVVTTQLGLWRVANVAHAVGAGLGALLGLAVGTRGARRAAAALGAAAVVGASVAGATALRPRVNLAADAGQDSAYLAYVALEAGRAEEAVVLSREAIRIRPGNAAWWYNLGVAYGRVDRPDEAEEAYRRAFEIEPGSASYRRALASAIWQRADRAAEQGRDEEALRLYREGLAVDDRAAFAWHNLGVKLASLGQHAEAVEAFRRALAIDPEEASLRVALAHTLGSAAVEATRAERHEEAARLGREAVELDAWVPELWYAFGVASSRLGRPEEALAAYRRAIALRAEEPAYRRAAASAAWELGRRAQDGRRAAEALEHYREATELDPADASAWRALGEMLAAAGKPGEAAKALERAKALGP